MKLSAHAMIKVSRTMRARRASFLNDLLEDAGLRAQKSKRGVGGGSLAAAALAGSAGTLAVPHAADAMSDFMDPNTKTKTHSRLQGNADLRNLYGDSK